MPYKSLLQYGTTHFSAVLMKKQDCHPHISSPIIAKGTMSCVSTCTFLDTDCDLKPLQVHGATCQAQLEGSHFFTHHTSGLKLHKNHHKSAPISMSCQMGTYPGTACTLHTASWFVFSACTTFVLTSVLQDEPAYHVLQKMDLATPRDFSWWWPSNSSQKDSPGRAVCISTSPHSLI